MSDTKLVQPQGRLDALGARNLWTELEPLSRQANALILIDMTETKYISSDGLRVLMRGSKAAKQHGGKVVLCCLSARIAEIIAMAGLDHVLEIYQTQTAAERALQEHRAAAHS